MASSLSIRIYLRTHFTYELHIALLKCKVFANTYNTNVHFKTTQIGGNYLLISGTYLKFSLGGSGGIIQAVSGSRGRCNLIDPVTF